MMQGPIFASAQATRAAAGVKGGGGGICRGEKGTLGSFFFVLQSRGLWESRSWLALCREAVQPRNEEERKAWDKQLGKQRQKQTWGDDPGWHLHHVCPDPAPSGAGDHGLVSRAPLPAAVGTVPKLPFPPLPRAPLGSARGVGVWVGEGAELTQLEGKSLDGT